MISVFPISLTKIMFPFYSPMRTLKKIVFSEFIILTPLILKLNYSCFSRILVKFVGRYNAKF